MEVKVTNVIRTPRRINGYSIYKIIIDKDIDTVVDDKLVNNSGSDVTADKRTPPINAPDNFVFLSNKSTYIDALIDNNTTAAASAK